MPVPYTFGTATAAIPLSQLDSNFATAITLGNTAVYLGNTTTSIGNLTLTNVTISSGNLTLTNVSVTTANVSGTANITTLVTTNDATIQGVTVGRGAGAVANNTAVGASALPTTSIGGFNTALGYQAATNFSGGGNVLIGSRTLGSSVTPCTGNYNTVVGDSAGYALQGTASSNTFIGNSSGELISSGNRNTIIGTFSGNSGGLDIRTASNYIVLSDGAGNPLISTANSQTVALKGAVPNSGTGITFPATQSASSDANTLDDYEEGTWTPADASGSSLSFTVTSATYTKIGRIVNLFGYFTFPSTASVNPVLLSGLPFTVATNIFAPVVCETNAGIIAYIRALGGGTNLDIRLINGDTQVLNATMSTRIVIFSMTYQTT